MGYTLEIYAISYVDLLRKIRDLALLETLRPRSQEEDQDWRQGVRQLFEGSLSGDNAAAVFSALVRSIGRPLVALQHASKSGIIFREVVSRLLQSNGEPTLNRPIESLYRDDLPWFGWLLWKEMSSRSVSTDVNTDVRGWEADVEAALDFARQHCLDVITIYT